MIALSKSEVIPLLVNHYREQLQISSYHLYTYQQKYTCSLEDFEQRVKNSSEENFEQWDDYMSWKGHSKSAASLVEKIKQIENGLFEVA